MRIHFDHEDFCVCLKQAGETTAEICEQWKAQHAGEPCSVVFPLDKAIGGLIVLSKTVEARQFLKNAYGSELFTFEFVIWARVASLLPLQWHCDLSIAWDPYRQRAFPSKEKGKKAHTQFTVEQSYGSYVRLRAITSYLRAQQIQLHGYYGHLEIIGDALFSKYDCTYLSDLKPDFKKRSYEKPLSKGLHLYLQCVHFVYHRQSYHFSVELPKDWQILEKQLARYLTV